MSLISVAFIFVGSVCFTLGLLHLLIFFRRRELKADLAFSCMAFAIALSSLFEVWAFQTGLLSEYITLLKATLSVQCIVWICLGWFVYYFTQSTRCWPPLAITALYSIALFINLYSPGSILFREIVELTPFTLANGEIIYFGNGPAHPLRIIPDISWVILLCYTAVASVEYGRKCNAKRAVVFSGTIFLCLGLGYLHGTMIDFGIVDPPYLGSFLFLPLSLVMSNTLASHVVRASVLADEIKSAEALWRNLLEHVNLFVIGIDRDKKICFANQSFLQTTGYEKTEVVNLPFIEIVPENLKEEIEERMRIVIQGTGSIAAERHLPIITKSGEIREVLWANVVVANNGNSVARTLSIGKDITDHKNAELARDNALLELKSLKEQLEEENISLKEMIDTDHGFKEIVGESDGLLYVLSKIQQVAETDSTVLVFGETGTGKELVANAIHRESSRANKPFIRINCAAIPAELVESELFGHEPGAFTNAMKLRRGKFELAEGGTIFLDEISEMPMVAQAKLLNVLQERVIERVGGSRTLPVDVRVIAATNRSLEQEIAKGRFRADLFYRLNIYPITVPPLRDRSEDVPPLVRHFILRFNGEFGKNIKEVPQLVMNSLINYGWPGNIRELRNIIERAVITSTSENLMLPNELHLAREVVQEISTKEIEIMPLAQVERQHIKRALEKTDWRISGAKGAARLLDMNPSTLRSRIKKLGLERI